MRFFLSRPCWYVAQQISYDDKTHAQGMAVDANKLA